MWEIRLKETESNILKRHAFINNKSVRTERNRQEGGELREHLIMMNNVKNRVGGFRGSLTQLTDTCVSLVWQISRRLTKYCFPKWNARFLACIRWVMVRNVSYVKLMYFMSAGHWYRSLELYGERLIIDFFYECGISGHPSGAVECKPRHFSVQKNIWKIKQ